LPRRFLRVKLGQVSDVGNFDALVVAWRTGPEVVVKINPVKRALKEGKPQVGTWLSLGSVVAARFLARTGLPWLTVDMEHTHTDIQTAAMMFGAIADAGCVPLVRIHTGRHDLIKAVLDCGAMGIVAPMVMDADEARTIVAATKYPPRGNRSIGGGLHAMNFGCTAEEYYRHADDEILVVIQAEHIAAVDLADEIYSVPGIDAIFVGPNDLSYSMRKADGTPPGKQEFEDTLTRIREAAARQGVPCGLHVFSVADAKRRIEEGWQFIAVNSELKMMMQGAAEVAKQMHPELSAGELARY
jgi:4-hydroxy-2-oxoheptanedioate aldolase